MYSVYIDHCVLCAHMLQYTCLHVTQYIAHSLLTRATARPAAAASSGDRYGAVEGGVVVPGVINPL